MNDIDPDKLYKISEIATVLRVAPRTVRKYCFEGKITAFRVGGHWRILGSDFWDFAINVMKIK